MKKTLLLFCLFLIFLFLTTGIQASAMSTGFSLEEIPPSQQEQILKNLHITYLSNAPLIRSFENFAVNEQEQIVTGSDISPQKTLCVYDANGTFLYGYTFITLGAYDIEWDQNNILVYTVRGDIAFSLNSSGECMEIKKIPNTLKNQQYWPTLRTAQKQLGSNQYVARNFKNPVLKLYFIMFPRTEIVKIDATGAEIVVLNCNPTINDLATTPFLSGLIFGILLSGTIVYISYADFLSLLYAIIPPKNAKEYQHYRSVVTSETYKKHVKRWRRISLLAVLVYGIVYTVMILIIGSALHSFLIALISHVICFEIIGNIEFQQRKSISIFKGIPIAGRTVKYKT